MDSKLARWAILAFLDMPTIQNLHELELKLSRQKKTWELALYQMMSRGLLEQFQLAPFWDPNPRFSETEKEQRMKQFGREIYPSWGRIWDRWVATWESPDCRPEIEVMHDCDIAIKRSGAQLDRLYTGTIEAIREKSVKAQKYGGQFSEAMR